MRKTLNLVALVLIGLAMLGCKKRISETDQQVLTNAREIVRALMEYSLDNARYPYELDDLVPYHLVRLPENVYSGGPMRDTGTDQFDPESSPGNVFYAKVLIQEEVLNFSLVVYGEKGIIRNIRRSPMAAN